MNKFTTISCNLIRIIGIILTGYLFLQGLFTVCCIQSVTEKTFYVENGVIRQLVGIVFTFVVIAFFIRSKLLVKLQKHCRLVIIIAGAAVIGIFAVWINLTKFRYASDMELVFRYAQMFNTGDYSGWMPGGYPFECSHQNGLILFVEDLVVIMD